MKKAYTRLIPLGAFGMSAGLLWDAWWHVAVGRDEFWVPPHILLYVCLAILILVSFIAWQKTKLAQFRNLFFIALFFPITGILDQLWHSIFGVENLVSPIVVWSPPHLLILASLVGITFYSRKIAPLEENVFLRWLMHCSIFSAILAFALVFSIPLYPLGSYHIQGFWGAGFLAFIWLAIILYAQKTIKEPGTIILITLIFGALACIGPTTVTKPAEGIIIGALHNPPPWLFIFSFLVPAFFIEVAHSWNPILKGLIAGTILGALFYFPAVYFIDVPFYGMTETLQAVFSSMIGGIFAGVLFLNYRKEKSF